MQALVHLVKMGLLNRGDGQTKLMPDGSKCCARPTKTPLYHQEPCMFNVGGDKKDRLGYVLCAPAVDGLVNAGVILMHELMGMLKQEVDAMEDSSHDYVILGAYHMKVVLLPTYKVVVGHK